MLMALIDNFRESVLKKQKKIKKMSDFFILL